MSERSLRCLYQLNWSDPASEHCIHMIIAIDFDDVMAATFSAMMAEHNLKYGTDLTNQDICSNFLYQIRGWGNPLEVEEKLKSMGDLLTKTEPLPGLKPALQRLHELGYTLYIVTARGKAGEASVKTWLQDEGISVGCGPNDLISGLFFAGSWQSADDLAKVQKVVEADRLAITNETLLQACKTSVQSGKGALTKLEILRRLGADVFIDDSFTNLGPMFSVTVKKPQCLLFGTYQWGERRTAFEASEDFMTYEERIAAGDPPFGFEVVMIPGVERVKDWAEVVCWVQRWQQQSQ